MTADRTGVSVESTRNAEEGDPARNTKSRMASKGMQQKARRARRKLRAQEVTQLSKSLPPGDPIRVHRVSFNSMLSALPGQGYRGRRGALVDVGRRGTWTKERAMSVGLQYVQWDGVTRTVLVDEADMVVGVLAGRPDDAGYLNSMHQLEEQFRQARIAGKFTNTQRMHRRGRYEALHYGVSFGNGQSTPSLLTMSGDESKADLARALYESEGARRVASFQDACLWTFAPKIAHRYAEVMKALGLGEPEANVFAACTFNIGENVATELHADSQNFGPGLCAVTSFGCYDPKEGGHIILVDFGIVVEFPPHSTILIPSAWVTHGNTAIAQGEERMSMTQYLAAGLIIWAARGFRKPGLGPPPPAVSKGESNMFMKLDDLCKRYDVIVYAFFVSATRLHAMQTNARILDHRFFEEENDWEFRIKWLEDGREHETWFPGALFITRVLIDRYLVSLGFPPGSDVNCLHELEGNEDNHTGDPLEGSDDHTTTLSDAGSETIHWGSSSTENVSDLWGCSELTYHSEDEDDGSVASLSVEIGSDIAALSDFTSTPSSDHVMDNLGIGEQST